MPRVFISYSSADREFVDRLVRDLNAAGIDAFYDQAIPPGESWAESLANAIESAQFLLVVLSPDAVASPWVEQEIRIGLAREAEGKAYVIPIMIRPCDIPPSLAAKTYASFERSYEVGLERILAVLGGAPPRPATEATTDYASYLEQARYSVARFRSDTPAAANHPERTDGDRPKCFVVMPFGDEDLQVVYEDFVKPVIEDECGLRCERGDDVFGSNVIMDDIRRSIDEADMVLADLTRKNANVFYEVGICHTLDKPVLLLAQSTDDVPFDLRHRRVLLYDYTPRGCKRLEKKLREHIRSMMGKLEAG